jgi:hypothetical protein
LRSLPAENHAAGQIHRIHDLWKHLIVQEALAISFTLGIRVRPRWRTETRHDPLAMTAVELAKSSRRQPPAVRNLDKWLWAASPISRHRQQFDPIPLAETR